ncbi:PREDICTED: uncharacterized protein LOC105501200 [Colobus angolensis palliatus]|uniref:uncharacterized protein LOC105501200 n=1 Tax=Colobus angolensis palliatus TaxID=336983 RepID=UPI0005F53411|nr:PREDICTED: uncharacterized protein LOC105501200 [Colobus angolensis palliatus]
MAQIEPVRPDLGVLVVIRCAWGQVVWLFRIPRRGRGVEHVSVGTLAEFGETRPRGGSSGPLAATVRPGGRGRAGSGRAWSLLRAPGLAGRTPERGSRGDAATESGCWQRPPTPPRGCRPERRGWTSLPGIARPGLVCTHGLWRGKTLTPSDTSDAVKQGQSGSWIVTMQTDIKRTLLSGTEGTTVTRDCRPFIPDFRRLYQKEWKMLVGSNIETAFEAWFCTKP